MTRIAALAAAMAALALTGCQTTQTEANYVKMGPGPKVETAVAECKAISAKARHFVIGIGGPEMLVVGLVGTAVATAAKQAQVFEQCMTAQGYGKVGAKPAEGAAATAGGAATAGPPAPGAAVAPAKAAPAGATPKPKPIRQKPRPQTPAADTPPTAPKPTRTVG